MAPASRRRTVPVLAAVLLALTALGCGDDDAVEPEPTTTSTREASPQPAELTDERREFERRVTEAIEDAPGGSAVDAQCAVERLRTSVSNAQVDAAVEAVREGGELPRAAIDAAYEAGRRCAR